MLATLPVRKVDNLPITIASSSMAFYGFFAPALPGVICPTVMELGKPSQGASMLGASEDYGNRAVAAAVRRRRRV